MCKHFGREALNPYLFAMTFSLLLLSHWLGDFAFQSSDMALGKCHSMKWLLYHVGTYTAILLVFCLFLLPLSDVAIYVGANAVLHLITDYFTSRWAQKHRKVPRKFFPIIGLDQLIHTLTLYWTLEYLPELPF